MRSICGAYFGISIVAYWLFIAELKMVCFCFLFGWEGAKS
jgi:hypothetical protein